MKTNLRFFALGLLFILASSFENKQGKLFKGTALIETEAILIHEKSNEAIKSIVFDPQKSTLQWTGYGEVGNYSLTGSIGLKAGTFKMVNGTVASGNITIDVTSINHDNNSLKEHLKSDDFFEINHYPTATLKIIKSQLIAPNEMEVWGTLQIKKTIKTIVFKMHQNNKSFSGTITIDRSQFGIKYGSTSFFDDLGDRAIKNNFDLQFNLVGL